MCVSVFHCDLSVNINIHSVLSTWISAFICDNDDKVILVWSPSCGNLHFLLILKEEKTCEMHSPSQHIWKTGNFWQLFCVRNKYKNAIIRALTSGGQFQDSECTNQVLVWYRHGKKKEGFDVVIKPILLTEWEE